MRTSFLRTLAAASFATAASFTATASLAYPSFGPAQPATPADYATGGLLGGPQDTSPSIATDGTDFLVVWSDGGAIECARHAAGGVLLDTPPLQLALSGATPTALWDGTKYLVVSGGSAQRVDPATGTADAAFALSGAGAGGLVAFGGGQILDVWQDGTGALTGALYDETGAVVKAGIALPSGAVQGWGVAASGGQFFVAWNGSSTIGGVRVSSAGAALDVTPIAIDAGHVLADAGGAQSSVANLAVAGSPSGYLVAWYDGRSSVGLASTYAARIDTSGAVADPGGLLLSDPGGAAYPTWDGAEWWLAGLSSGFELGATGSAVTSANYGIGASYNIMIQVAAANPGARLAAWASDGAIRGVPVAPSGAGSVTSSPVGLAMYLARQAPLCGAASAAGYLVAVTDGNAVAALRFDHEGTAISPAVPTFYPSQVAACGAIGGTYYLATEAGVSAFATSGPADGSYYEFLPSLTRDGGPSLGSAPLGMACTADRCLYTWAEPGLAAGPAQETARAMIFDAQGNTLVPAFDVTTSIDVGVLPTVLVATDGSSFFLAEDGYVLPVAADGTHGTFVSAGDAQAAALAAGGGVFLLGDSQGDAVDRFDGTGALLGFPQPLPLAAPDGESIAAAWDGAGFFVAQATAGAAAAPIVGMELSSAPFVLPDGGSPGGDAGVDTSPLFTAPGAVLALSDGAGNVAAFATQPASVYATPRLVARFAFVPDAGTDAGAPADAGAADAAAPTDAATTSNGQDDAGGSPIDATTILPDGSSGGAGDAVAPSSCGCYVAGVDAGSPWAWMGLGVLPLAVARARRRRTR